ncbi:MAG: arylsulfatase [Planctomycetota bacterium]
MLVITDDQGYGDLGCHGNPVLKTPHLDVLHAEAVRFTDFHVSPTCSPTRAALLTGRTSNRTGVWHTIDGRSLLAGEERTLDQYLADAGYATAMFGKWHLGDNYPLRPEDRGFGEVFRHGGGGIGQTSDAWNNTYFGGRFVHGGVLERHDRYCTDLWFDGAIDFVTDAAAKDRPFFVYLATNAAHGPFHAPPEAAEPYAALGTATANFLGMIANIDENIGRLRAFLDERGLAENTLFLFTTDNGTAGGNKVFDGGMRGKKGSEFEGGHRVPLFAYWPVGGVTGGRDVETLTAHIDVVPTLAELCGFELSGDHPVEGESLTPLLRGEAVDWADRIVVTDSQRIADPVKWRKSSTMSGRWRLVNGEQLYDVRKDPAQKKDVSRKHPDVVGRLRGGYEEWWASLVDGFDRVPRITVGHDAENPARLTAHDANGLSKNPWNQGAVRDGAGTPRSRPTWRLRVATAGRYRIVLSRWPEEAGVPMSDGLPAEPDVPGQKGYHAHDGVAVDVREARVVVDGEEQTRVVASGDSSAVFEADLAAGPLDFVAELVDAAGTVRPAYFVAFERLGPAAE